MVCTPFEQDAKAAKLKYIPETVALLMTMTMSMSMTMRWMAVGRKYCVCIEDDDHMSVVYSKNEEGKWVCGGRGDV